MSKRVGELSRWKHMVVIEIDNVASKKLGLPQSTSIGKILKVEGRGAWMGIEGWLGTPVLMLYFSWYFLQLPLD